MTAFGLDCLNPPSYAEAVALRALGWEFLNVYVDGPFLTGHTPWPNAAVRMLSRLGFKFNPLYVGQQYVPGRRDLTGIMTYEQGVLDGTDATIKTGACGFNETTPLGFDLEAGSWEANPNGVREYLRGAAEVVNSAGHKFELYCDRLTSEQFGTDLVDLLWVSWPRFNGNYFQHPPVGYYDPVNPPPAWDMWQFGFGGYINGRSYDYNSARDDFPFAEYST